MSESEIQHDGQQSMTCNPICKQHHRPVSVNGKRLDEVGKYGRSLCRLPGSAAPRVACPLCSREGGTQPGARSYSVTASSEGSRVVRTILPCNRNGARNTSLSC